MAVTVEHRGPVAVLRVDRPPANALDAATLHEVIGALNGLAGSRPAALVIAGRKGFFSAGADLKVVPNLGLDGQREMVRGINDLVLSAYQLPFPVVGAITGHAIAGGFVFALATDVRIGSASGRYGLTEVKVGVPYPAAAIGIVKAELSAPAARYLALSASLVDAEWCLRHGFFDEVVEGPRVLERSIEVAQELAQVPADVYARTKRELRAKVHEQLRLAAETDPLLDRWVDEEGQAAAQRALLP